MPISSGGTMMPVQWQGESISSLEQTHQPVIKFAYANLSPVWRAADAGC